MTPSRGNVGTAGAPGKAPPAMLQVLRWAVLAAIIVIVALAFSDALQAAWSQLRSEPISFTWHFAVATVLFILAVPLSGFLWGRILSDIGSDRIAIAPLDAMAAHSMAWVLKYIPGQVGSLGYKLVWGRQRGYPAAKVSLSFIYENLFLQIASLVPALAILAMAFGIQSLSNTSALLALSTVGVILAAVAGVGPMIRLAARKAPSVLPAPLRSGAINVLSAGQCAGHVLLFLGPRLLNAAGFILIVYSIAPVGPGDWLPLGAIYVLAGALGILAFFVPSGLGVREGVIVLFASAIIGEPKAIIVAIVARLLSVVADGVVLGIYFGLKRGRGANGNA